MQITISATDLKNKVSEVLNRVHFKGEEVIVTKTGKPVVKIVPFSGKNEKKAEVGAILDKYYGVLPEFPNVVGKRYMRKRTVSI